MVVKLAVGTFVRDGKETITDTIQSASPFEYGLFQKVLGLGRLLWGGL